MPARRDDSAPSTPNRFLNIRSKKHLALRLGIPLAVLENLATFRVLQYEASRSHPKKDSTKPRTIDAPRRLLKKVQQRINRRLLQPLWLPEIIHGYRPGRSVKTALLPHQGNPFLWIADVRDFYPSVSSRAVYSMFERLGCTPDVARLLTQLSTHRYRLPQGAPTSPSLANLYLRLSGVARRLEGIADRHQLALTIFGDDIIVSRKTPFRGLEGQLTAAVLEAGLRLNQAKTIYLKPGTQHRVLGAITDSRGAELDVPRHYRRQLARLLHLYRRRGPDAVTTVIRKPSVRGFLAGKIAYAKFLNARNARFEAELVGDAQPRAISGRQTIFTT